MIDKIRQFLDDKGCYTQRLYNSHSGYGISHSHGDCSSLRCHLRSIYLNVVEVW